MCLSITLNPFLNKEDWGILLSIESENSHCKDQYVSCLH